MEVTSIDGRDKSGGDCDGKDNHRCNCDGDGHELGKWHFFILGEIIIFWWKIEIPHLVENSMHLSDCEKYNVCKIMMKWPNGNDIRKNTSLD